MVEDVDYLKGGYGMTNQEKLSQRFEHIDYSKIPVSNDVPNKRTLEAINGPIHFINDGFANQ